MTSPIMKLVAPLVVLVGVNSVLQTQAFKSSYNLLDEIPGHSVNGDFLPSVGDSTRVYIDQNRTSNDPKQRRFMRFTTCAGCRFRVTSLTSFSYPKCLWTNIFNDFDGARCAPGCTYLQLYDQDYINDTGRSYTMSGWQPFYTYSSKIYIVACYNDTPLPRVHFNLNLTVVDKTSTRRGSAYDTGPDKNTYITSPTFPNNYVQNQETYTYVIQAVNYNEYIELSFDDWNLATQSIVEFVNSEPQGPVYGSSHRPMVRSVGNELTVKFHTGKASTSSIRDFMGFKATYTVKFTTKQTEKPITDCGGYDSSRPGGVITLETKMSTRELYDCVWVLRRHPDYTMIYVKLIDLNTSPSYYQHDTNRVSIKGGVTSLGRFEADIGHSNVDDYLRRGFENNTGFYIRLRGRYQNSLDFVLAFASYKYGNCQYHEFRCMNSRCISSRLRCDGYDHCGDNSDEVCSSDSGEYSHYSYTISIGVIIPMVISIFLIVVICLLIIFIRRCRTLSPRNTRQPIASVSGNMARRNRRGRNRSRIRMNLTIQQDSPPSYDEVIQNTPIGYLNMAFMWSQPDVNTGMINPPTYEEATSPTSELPCLTSQNALNQSADSTSSSDSLDSHSCVIPRASDTSSDGSRLEGSLHQSSFSSDSTIPDRESYATYDSANTRSSVGSSDHEQNQTPRRGKVVRDEFIECPVSSSALAHKEQTTESRPGDVKEQGAVACTSQEQASQSNAATRDAAKERGKKRKKRKSRPDSRSRSDETRSPSSSRHSRNSNSSQNEHSCDYQQNEPEQARSPNHYRRSPDASQNEHSRDYQSNDFELRQSPNRNRHSRTPDSQNENFSERDGEVVLRVPSPSRMPVPAPRGHHSRDGRRLSDGGEAHLHGTYLSLSLDNDDREADIFV